MATETQIKRFAKFKVREAAAMHELHGGSAISQATIDAVESTIDGFSLAGWDTDHYPSVSMAVQALAQNGIEAGYEGTGIVRINA